MRFEKAEDLTDEAIATCDTRTLLNALELSYDIADGVERARIQALMEIRAGEIKCKETFKTLRARYDSEEKALKAMYKADAPTIDGQALPFEMTNKGIKLTIDNFLLAMRASSKYEGLRYNLITNAPEVHENGEIRRWNDADEAESRRFIEKTFGMYSQNKHYDALRLLLREREYNPILDIINGLKWDGEERCEHFLARWAKADDTPYTREVSRLIFAGGINRLYVPGCKFDDVPVLIGVKQGEGKSSLVRWLAINDAYFTEVKEIEGQKGIEAVEGAWICEVAELLALTKAKEQEAVKSYITTQRDKYRRPYDRQVTEYPRRCVFIGTTNNERFLKDKTGNRRFYPVKVHSSGYELFDHEEECRAYILQCWAEARDKYLAGNMPNFARRDLLAEYQAAQDEAMEDDWRVGAIEEYLSKKEPGTYVCIRQLKREALTAPEDRAEDPTPKESLEISTIMSKIAGWEQAGRVRLAGYGQQRCWRKAGERELQNYQDVEELPF